MKGAKLLAPLFINKGYEIPENIRYRMADIDYSLAEKKCPQRLAIGKLMKEALKEFEQRLLSLSCPCQTLT